MSICKNGLECKLENTVSVTIKVNKKHPLVKLANSIDWNKLYQLVLPDLKKSTSKLKWWLGRKLIIRIHLAVYLLQQLLNESDRGIEKAICYNAAYQVFCGKTIVDQWHCPDHTKVEEFRSRLSPQTQCELANEIAKIAVKYRFAKPQHIDIDSTVQEPDMQHPATSNLLIKTAVIAKRVRKLLIDKFPDQIKKVADIDIKKIMGIAKEYFFAQRKRASDYKERKQRALIKLWSRVSACTMPIIQKAEFLMSDFVFETLAQKQKNLIDHFIRKAPTLLSSLFDRYYEALPRKINVYSYFRDALQCFNKGKPYKACEFGRQFQIGRIEGNFLYSVPNTSIHMPDAASFKPMIKKHIELFQTPIESIATDKGYYSKDNEKLALDFNIEKVGVQRPIRKFDKPPNNPISEEDQQMLANRRAGIEPIIGHLKRHWQMGRSRMKNDNSTESSGYCAILGFNLRQMMRYLNGEVKLMES